MKKVLLVLSSILLSSSLFAQENNTFVEEKVDINAIKNQIFFKVEGSKAYIMSPVSYLNDNDRRKTDAIEYINDRFNQMIIDWNKFAYKFQQIEDKKIQEILDSKDEAKIDDLVEYLESDSDRLSLQKMILKYTGLPTYEQRQANQFLSQYSFFDKDELQELLKKSEEKQLAAFLDQINEKLKDEKHSEIFKKFPAENQEDVQKILNRTYNSQFQNSLFKSLYDKLKNNDIEANQLDNLLVGSVYKMTKGLLDYLQNIKSSGKKSNFFGYFNSDKKSALEKHFDSISQGDHRVNVRRIEEILEISDSFDQMQAFTAYFHKVKLEDPDLFGKSYAENFSFSQVKALAARQLKKANELILSDGGFNIGGTPELPTQIEMEEQKLEEYNKNMAYFLNNTIELRENFEKTFNNLAALTDEEQRALKHSYHSSLPDIAVIQIQGQVLDRILGFGRKIDKKPPSSSPGTGIGTNPGIDIGNSIGNDFDFENNQVEDDKTKKVKYKPTWLERIFSTHPRLAAIYNLMRTVAGGNKLRIAFLVRPWAITEIDLKTGLRKEYIDAETNFNVFYSVSKAQESLVSRSDNFFRVSTGGIWVNLKNLEDLDLNMFIGGSYTKGHFNIKAGVTHPVTSPKLPNGFDRNKMPEKVGAYLLVGGQVGESPIPYLASEDTYGNLNPKEKEIAEKQGFYARTMSRLKNKPYLDVSITKNIVSIFDAIGVDSSFLSDELRRLLNIDNNGGSGGGYGCPSWICGSDDPGIIIGGGNDNGGGSDIPILGGGGTIIVDEPGGGIFITEDMEDYMHNYIDDNRESYQKCWLSMPDVKRRRFFIDMHFRRFSTLCLPMDKLVENSKKLGLKNDKIEVQEVEVSTEEAQ